MLRHVIIILLFISSSVMVSVQLERSHFFTEIFLPHEKKSNGVRSGEHADQSTDPRPISE